METKAPEGYQLDSRPHPVTFDLEGEKDGEILVELDVTNQRIPTDAPKTGDDTVSPMLLLGICAVCTGILIGWYVCQYGGLRRHLLILLISLSGILLSSVLWMIARKKMQQTS